VSIKPFLIGRVVKRVQTERGGDFFLVLAEGPTSKRFRADARLFSCPDKIAPETLVCFYPDEARSSKRLGRIREIVFQPDQQTPER